MVQLMIGHKGSGKTKKMIEQANDSAHKNAGNTVFINKDHSLMYDLTHRIRVVSMDEFPYIDTVDGFVGFVCGMISADHDLETIFIDSILKYRAITIDDMKGFLAQLRQISECEKVNFVLSVSADAEELKDAIEGCEIC